MLKAAWTATLFAVGLVHTGSWHAAVLDQWATSCTMLPDPAPYPHELLRLANGEPSWHGIKQLFTCAPDPEWNAFLGRLHAKKTAPGSPTTNQNGSGDTPASPKINVGQR